MSNRGSMEGADNPIEIIDYIAIQAHCSKYLAQLTLMAVSGWDGESNGGEVKGLSSFADDALDLSKEIVYLTKDIIDNGGLPEDQDISPDFVAYCLLRTMNPDRTLNKDDATILAFSIHIFTTENPRFNQNEIVDTVVQIKHTEHIDLQPAMSIVFQRLNGLPLPPQGGKSKKSKSKKYNRKSRGKKHKRSKSKKIRKS